MSSVLPQLGFQLGIGSVGGFIVGYFVKKLSKLAAFVIGLFIVALLYLGIRGIININYDALWAALRDSLGLAESTFSWLIGLISLLPFAGSFVVGFLLGFKLG